MALPRPISEAWLKQMRTRLASTATTSPAHAELSAEISAAEAEQARFRSLEAACKAKGLLRNAYGTRLADGSGSLEPLQGFAKKINGRWVGYTVAQAAELAGWSE